MNLIVVLLTSLVCCTINMIFSARSTLRPIDPAVSAELVTRWDNNSINHYHLKDSHLEMHPIFFYLR